MIKRESNQAIPASLQSFDDKEFTTIKRKSAYAKSRLPTFGSLTTGKPMHQGSNFAIGVRARNHHFLGGGATQMSDDGGARKQMTPKEPAHHHHHMTSH